MLYLYCDLSHSGLPITEVNLRLPIEVKLNQHIQYAMSWWGWTVTHTETLTHPERSRIKKR